MQEKPKLEKIGKTKMGIKILRKKGTESEGWITKITTWTYFNIFYKHSRLMT